jgi:hypothetical protein
VIRKPTVLVLGAGASIPYGFPSGAQLRKEICKLAANPAPIQTGMAVLSLGGVDVGELQIFGEAFAKSNIVSIDAFLAKRPELARIGKLVIAAILCDREKPDRLFSDENDDHWYQLLWNAIHPDTQAAPDVLRNNLRVISFNYDRSLEFFLHQAIKHSWGLSDDEAMKLVNKLWFLHVYGSLGKFEATPQPGHRTYGQHLDADGLKAAAESIQVIPEARDDKAFQMARTWLDWAERIWFLGFGFDSLNIERLGLSSVLEYKKQHSKPMPMIFASAYGRTREELASDGARLTGGLCPLNAIREDSSSTLRQTPYLLS